MLIRCFLFLLCHIVCLDRVGGGFDTFVTMMSCYLI